MIPAFMMKPAPRRRSVEADLKTTKLCVNCRLLSVKVSVVMPMGTSVVLFGIIIGGPWNGLMRVLCLTFEYLMRLTDEQGSRRATCRFPSI